jgi:hypothetical protein
VGSSELGPIYRHTAHPQLPASAHRSTCQAVVRGAATHRPDAAPQVQDHGMRLDRMGEVAKLDSGRIAWHALPSVSAQSERITTEPTSRQQASAHTERGSATIAGCVIAETQCRPRSARSAAGASSSFWLNPEKVSLVNPQRSLGLRREPFLMSLKDGLTFAVRV